MARRHLEREILDVLWAHPEGQTAGEVTAALAELGGQARDARAATTVHTVLERLRLKGLVERRRVDGVFRHHAVRDRVDLVAEAMLAVLQDSSDRGLALARFVDGVSPEDAEALRRALGPADG